VKIGASTVLSFVSCKREAWFMHHGIIPDQTNPFIELGKFIHESAYERLGEKSVELPGMKIDMIWQEDGMTIVGEIKKSSRSFKGARMQLLYYMYALRQLGIDSKGYIMIPREKRRIEVILDEEAENELEQLLQEVGEIVSAEKPPEEKWRSICSKCGYVELCWA